MSSALCKIRGKECDRIDAVYREIERQDVAINRRLANLFLGQ